MKTKLLMKSILVAACVMVSAGMMLWIVTPAQAETLSGTVLDNGHKPIPGLTVFLVNSKAGRSAPSVTDPLGRFFFSAVPSIPDRYYLEIYWGNRLVFRQVITVHGNVNLRPIVLR